MGQRGAIVMLLFTGGAVMVPLAVLSTAAVELGRSAVPAGVCLLWTGFACLVAAKWPQVRQGDLWSFGPRRLSHARRRLYWGSYAIMAVALTLTMFALAFHRHGA